MSEKKREREEMAANLRMVKRLDQIMTQVVTWKPRVEKERWNVLKSWNYGPLNGLKKPGFFSK